MEVNVGSRYGRTISLRSGRVSRDATPHRVYFLYIEKVLFLPPYLPPFSEGEEFSRQARGTSLEKAIWKKRETKSEIFFYFFGWKEVECVYWGACNVLFSTDFSNFTFPFPAFFFLLFFFPYSLTSNREFWWIQSNRKRVARRSVKSNPADVATNLTKILFLLRKFFSITLLFSTYSIFIASTTKKNWGVSFENDIWCRIFFRL